METSKILIFNWRDPKHRDAVGQKRLRMRLPSDGFSIDMRPIGSAEVFLQGTGSIILKESR